MPDFLWPQRGNRADSTCREVALLLAEDPPATPAAARAVIELGYGLTHEPTVANLLPSIIATAHALAGLPHNPAHLDPVVATQLHHTLALDGRPLTGRGDVGWYIDNGRLTQPRPARHRHRSNNV